MGRMLVLDSALQCAERDEAGYHEYITHTALCRKGAAAGTGKRACIIGGGDGGAAREILRHDDFGAVDLVDIDAEVRLVIIVGSLLDTGDEALTAVKNLRNTLEHFL